MATKTDPSEAAAMAIQIILSDPADASRVVDALLDQADVVERDRPTLASRYRRLADHLGDELDALPTTNRSLSGR
jgi:hypothetical protein